jgi:NAD(P)H-hydrate epimerase
MRFCTAEQMRRLDQKTIEEVGLPGVVLMENAGRGAARLSRDHWGPLAGRRVDVVCGKGNNGGDGFVIGRIFHGWGARVRFFLLGRKADMGGDAGINLRVAENMGLEIVEIAEDAHIDRLTLDQADLVVDAVFGTGLNSEVRGRYRDAIERINQAPADVLAVDVPSGISADSGQVLGVAVRADLTATFGLPKTGLLIPPGETAAGRLEVVDIGIPPHVLREADPGRELITMDSLAGLVPDRRPGDHKGVFGHLLIVAGSTGKTGAAVMTALAACRTGTGLVTAAGPATLNPVMEQKLTEVMTEPLPEEPPGLLRPEALDRILELCQDKSAVVLGPGLGLSDGIVELVDGLIRQCPAPLIIDADGLNALARTIDAASASAGRLVLTPHPGEMARLTGLGVKEILNDRFSATLDLAQKTGAVVALKGHRTLVAEPGGRFALNTTGGPHMASGGMGDVLTGVIGGLAAQGLAGFDAARLGVFAHGRAADLAARDIGPVGLVATDLLDYLPGLWPGLQKGAPE